MSGLRFFCFLVALPFLAALGHDGYVYYLSAYEKGENLPLRLSDVGYLWQTYSADTFELARQTVSPEAWEAWYVPVLSQATVLVTGAFAAFVYAALTILWLFGVWPFEKQSVYARGSFSLPGEKQKTQFKYKRK